MRHVGWTRLALATVLVAVAFAGPAHAGGPLALRATGQPYLWPNGGTNIPYNPDQGALGTLSNADAVAQTAAAFQAWQDVATSTVTYVNAGQLAVDVTAANFGPFFSPAAPDGLSAIVYDANGAIFNAIFGPGSGVLGFAGPEWVNTVTGQILEGRAFLNGGVLLGTFPAGEFLDVQTHEFGHYTNLAHTVINGQVAGFADHRGPSPNNTFPAVSFVNRIETMYPFIFINGGMETPHQDDIASVSTLYPEPGFAPSTGSITGTIFAPDTLTKLTGVNVIARNIVNPYDDAVSALSSDFTDSFLQTNPFTGVYTLNGLTPGASYAVYVDRIQAGGFSTPPLTTLPGPEEFHNGVNESEDASTDTPSVFTPVASTAGVPSTGVNIVFNKLVPGPITIGDDATVQIFPPFTFSFCGTDYTSFFLNSNGNLTFGAGSTDLTETEAEHLSGPPRIAALWDDLNPSSGGVVSFDQTPDSLTVTFSNVPEFPTVGSNSFSITLFRASSHFDIAYGGLTAQDGLAGFSCGGTVTTARELESDLSGLLVPGESISGRNASAIFERFTSLDNDLDNLTLPFSAPNEFKDTGEPNNDFTHAERVRLPYSSADRFTEIRPLGADVDFFRFQASAGETLVAETRPGNNLDTVVGVFDVDTGVLLAADDDSGPGLLSRLVFAIPADGLYAVAVSTFPDLAFTGAGGSVGRYILELQTVQGTVLALGDDSTVQVPLGFTFPYQGGSWTSMFVNSNGNITFGVGSIDLSETVAEFLSGPPRIAPLWDDLNPTAGGLVTLQQNGTSATVSFLAVPEFSSTVGNTFAVTLTDTGQITFSYGSTNHNDGIVGVTQGGGAADPGETDLSAAASLSASGTTYELFGTGQFDLDLLTLVALP